MHFKLTLIHEDSLYRMAMHHIPTRIKQHLTTRYRLSDRYTLYLEIVQEMRMVVLGNKKDNNR